MHVGFIFLPNYSRPIYSTIFLSIIFHRHLACVAILCSIQ